MGLLSRFVVLSLALAGCAPELEDPGSRVTSRRVLAVRFEPAEAAPGERLRAVALVADPRGVVEDVPVRWSWCEARPALTELAPAAARCLTDGPWQRALGEGARVEATMPTEACRRFGPDPPEQSAGGDARPVDPDVTGGYSAPVRATVDAASALGFARLRCNLAGVTREQSVEWARRYRPNENPAIEALERVDGASATPIAEGAALAVAPGATVTLRVRWPACGAEGPCGGAERYARFDPAAREIIGQREAMRVSWYTTGGRFRDVRTGRERGDEAREVSNAFTAPTAAGEMVVWVVLRDERGGVAWRALRVRVGP